MLRRFLACGIKYLEFGDPQCGGKFVQCTEGILSVGEISTVNRRDPQCGGKFLQCKEEILGVGNIVYSVKKNPRRGGYLYRASVKKNL